MIDDLQPDLLSSVTDLDTARILFADLHDDLIGKVARFRQLNELSLSLGRHGTMLPGGETAFAAWTEARTSFVHGNYMATVMLCQGLAEHILAAQVRMLLGDGELPSRITFQQTLELCIEHKLIGSNDANDLRFLMDLRNPLSHFRDINDPSNLSRRVMNTMLSAETHLFRDASFAIGMAVRLLSLPAFRVG